VAQKRDVADYNTAQFMRQGNYSKYCES